jgi:hypothetical protein
MHDSIVRALVETAIELSEAEIQHAHTSQHAAELRGRMLTLQGALEDLWPSPRPKPPRLTPEQLIEALRKVLG